LYANGTRAAVMAACRARERERMAVVKAQRGNIVVVPNAPEKRSAIQRLCCSGVCRHVIHAIARNQKRSVVAEGTA